MADIDRVETHERVDRVESRSPEDRPTGRVESGIERVDTDGAHPEPDTESGHGRLFTLARLLYAGPLLYMALNDLRTLDEKIEFAESEGVPAADVLVPLASGSLLFGSAGIAVWRLPRVASAAVAAFFLGVTPSVHQFWDEDDEWGAFMKNAVMLGGALAFLERARRE